jgi:hypothetical protein
MPCSFCAHEAAFGPFGAVHVCRSCSRRIALLAGDTSSRDVFWRERRQDEDEEAAPDNLQVPPYEKQDAVPPARTSSRCLTSPDDLDFAAFKVSVADLEDPETHWHLAVAYCEMGLYADALREGEFALTMATTDRVRGGALELLVTRPLLRPGGIERLRAALIVN